MIPVLRHLLLTNDFPPKVGGIQAYLYGIYSKLDPQSFVVVTTEQSNSKYFDDNQSFPIIRLRKPFLYPSISLLSVVTKICDDFNSQHVVLDPLFPLAAMGPLLKRRGIDYSIVLHGAEVTIPTRLPVIKQIAHRSLIDASCVICAGGFALKEAQRSYPQKMRKSQDLQLQTNSSSESKFRVVPPGVDLNTFFPLTHQRRESLRDELGLKKSDFVLITVARLVPRKGIDVILKSLEILSDPEIKLLIVGSGRSRHFLETKARQAGIQADFFGTVSNERLRELYALSDLFVLTPRSYPFDLVEEGFGIVYLEAAACKLASIAVDNGGISEAVIDGHTGYLLRKPLKVNQLAATIASAKNNRNIVEKLSEHAYKRVHAEFNYDEIASRFVLALDKNELG